MSKRRLLAAALGSAAVAAAIAASPPAVAEETGHWEGKGVLVVSSRTMLKVEDSANHSVSLTEWDGAIFNGQGKSFLDKARYQVVAPVDTAGARGGYKTFSERDGSKVFAKFIGTEAKPPEFRGTFEFTGGTGKYEGITGNGTFHLVMVSDKAAWDELVGDYKLPTPLAGSTTPPAGNDVKNR
ncbi:MAG TPA: hypothetical protein VF113_04435 [Stellaceae bacterium]